MSEQATMLLPTSNKVLARHWERLAVVYVRQSTMHQVQRNRESTAAQYSLTELAQHLGWRSDRILVIDDDLGVSGASAEGRVGFQRLLSEVALDHVGIIIGIEISRLARSCKDWYQLLELCAIFGTLICDLDGLYDPSAYNDRLLLGLKGTMSEAELHIIRQRMLQGSQQKARRGELVTRLPIGYLRDADGRVQLDPDEQARGAVSAIFDLFERIGTVSGVIKRMHDLGMQIGVRLEGGIDRGRLVWRRPHTTTVRGILTHPIYAGAYVYGRRERRKRPSGRGGKIWKPSDQWQVLLRDRMPAYITWEQHQANLEQMRNNRSSQQTKGAIRRGRALLCGLVVCGRCGYRMSTRYQGSASTPRYCCLAGQAIYGEPTCQGLTARALDEEVVRLALIAMEPSSLEVSLQVASDLQAQHDAAERLWDQRIERARYEVDRARRQYDAVEPENRLVARTLETEWDQKLTTHRMLTEEHARFVQSQPRLLTDAQQDEIRALATDLPALWNAPTTCDEDRKTILRQIIDKVVINVEEDTEWVEARIHWVGGQQTYTRLRRPVARIEQLSDFHRIRETIVRLRTQGLGSPAIAKVLNQSGLRTTSGKAFTAQAVRTWTCRYIQPERKVSTGRVELATDEWFLGDLARHLDVNHQTIRVWIRHGRVEVRPNPACLGGMIVKADACQLRALMAYRTELPPSRENGRSGRCYRRRKPRTSSGGVS